MEQVSALTLSETAQKFGDPGSPYISIMIGESRIERTLLDLGSSVNLLPFSVYEQLRLGELKNTSIKLQLADRLVKVPRGIVENVLIHVDKFYYPVDFVVLDMQQLATTIYQAPVILGRPFVTTSNALINCRSGVLKLTFENMTLKMNVFNTCKMPGDCDESEVHVVNLISELDEIKRECAGPIPAWKPKSRWKGRYIVKEVHPHGAVDIVNPKNGNSFTVNGQCLKPFLKVFDPHKEILLVQDSREVF
ncbi:hypothetical protein F2P56_029694 [Juglans regia]|uniref:Uncharacterized protein n=2 Tax=Juglans regia TaxID=51240 RepID=A0A833U2S1_JUGRE|nr:uncharacterized protein LOC108997315 [Juglans regia]KAF5449223.1 hypothetical protein F2P56_029694 [Juglans regia]